VIVWQDKVQIWFLCDPEETEDEKRAFVMAMTGKVDPSSEVRFGRGRDSL